jgi:hypothetical protein
MCYSRASLVSVITKESNMFTIKRDAQANWLLVNTETGIVVGTFHSREAALLQQAFVERRIAAHSVRKQALYIYA